MTTGTSQYLDGRWPILACASAGCGAPIVWARTSSGSRMPVNAAPDPAGRWRLVDVGGPEPALVYGPKDAVVLAAQAAGETVPLHTSHFVTCVHADRFRINTRRPR